MDNIWDYVGFDRTKIDRAREEAGRQMRETNQKFAEA